MSVGTVISFEYNGKTRVVKVEYISESIMTGWDYTANAPVGGYRSFKLENMKIV